MVWNPGKMGIFMGELLVYQRVGSQNTSVFCFWGGILWSKSGLDKFLWYKYFGLKTVPGLSISIGRKQVEFVFHLYVRTMKFIKFIVLFLAAVFFLVLNSLVPYSDIDKIQSIKMKAKNIWNRSGHSKHVHEFWNWIRFQKKLKTLSIQKTYVFVLFL